MANDFAATDVEEGFCQREEEESGEESGGRGLVEAADGGHAETHDESGDSDDHAASQENAAVDAMKSRMAGAKIRIELPWAENHEQRAGDDVNEREERIVREKIVERSELRNRIGRWRGRMVTVQRDGQQDNGAANGDSNADEG
jgi:hypothetical protein